jgi:protein-L-isoaspartate(D-aspartate) O-methyltransferase
MTPDFAAARQTMVDTQVRPNDVPDLALQSAMRRVPREACLPADKAHLAYADVEVEYAPGRWLLRPRDVAKLLFTVRPRVGDTVLAIAAPYAGAVLAQMGLAVTHLDDGDLKTPPAGTWDIIVCEGAVAAVPPAWPKALDVGGRLAVVVRQGRAGRLTLVTRGAEDIGSRQVFESTPPMMAGFEAEVGFAF